MTSLARELRTEQDREAFEERFVDSYTRVFERQPVLESRPDPAGRRRSAQG
jgi:hypothetical protein